MVITSILNAILASASTLCTGMMKRFSFDAQIKPCIRLNYTIKQLMFSNLSRRSCVKGIFINYISPSMVINEFGL